MSIEFGGSEGLKSGMVLTIPKNVVSEGEKYHGDFQILYETRKRTLADWWIVGGMIQTLESTRNLMLVFPKKFWEK